MNLQLTAQLDEAPATPVADDVARVLSDARLGDGAELLDALVARRIELGLSNAMVEEAAGLCDGHLTKVLGPSKERSPTLRTLDRVMTVLGLSFVLVVDPSKIERVQSRWRRRDETHVRARQLSQTTIDRARPHVLAELARRAARPRWAGVDAKTFVRAMVQEMNA
jgi:hypothetical protein